MVFFRKIEKLNRWFLAGLGIRPFKWHPDCFFFFKNFDMLRRWFLASGFFDGSLLGIMDSLQVIFARWFVVRLSRRLL